MRNPILQAKGLEGRSGSPSNLAQQRKSRVNLRVIAKNRGSELVFSPDRLTRVDVERIFGRMHFDNYTNMHYPFQTCIMQFWKAQDWRSVPYMESKKVPTGAFKSYSVARELLQSIRRPAYGSDQVEVIKQTVREYFRPSYSSGQYHAKKFIAEESGELLKTGSVDGAGSVELEGIIESIELDILNALEKHTKGLRRQSADEVYATQVTERKRLEIEFDSFILIVDDPEFAAVLHALEPCLRRIKERIQQLREWRMNGVPLEERDYVFHWDRIGKPEQKPAGFEAPFDHQWVMYKTHSLLDASADLGEMGTGKTLSCLMTIDKRIQEGKVRKGHVIVVAPTTTLELAWQKQINQFTPHLTSTIVKGSYAERMTTFLSPPKTRGDILLVNYESFAMETKVPQKNGEDPGVIPLAKLCEIVEWDFVILDECHKIKNPEAKRTGLLISAFKAAKYKLIMSGTINANKLFDIHCPFVHLNGAKNFNSLHHHHDGSELTLGELHGAFRGAYFRRSGPYYIPRRGTVAELREKLEEVSVRFLKSECLSLPEKMYIMEEIEMSQKQEQLYNALRDALVANLMDIDKRAGRVSVLGVLGLLTKLAEAANGWIYNDAGEAVELPWNPKLERTKELLSEIDLETNKVVIWSRFNHDLHLISTELRAIYGEDAVIVIHGGGQCVCGSNIKQRKEHVNAFLDLDPENPVKIAVVNQATGSHGIDLTSAAYEIFYSNSFSKTDRIQAEDRCHRPGMRDSLTIIDLVCKRTVDVQVMIALMTHKAMTVALLESLGLDMDVLGLLDLDDEAKESEPPVIKIQQQGPRECLLASCAMVAGKTIDEARTVASALGIVPWSGTHENMMKLFDYWGVGVRRAWEIKDGEKGIAFVIWPDKRGHAVAFHGGQVFNPVDDRPKPTREWLTTVMEKGGKLSKILVVTAI